jgi:membrane protein DedA with SNARE-associated domain
MEERATNVDDRFRPTRTASGPSLIAAIVIGPFLWVAGLVIVAVLVHKSDAIELGVLIAVGSILVAVPILIVVRLGRRREERRYAARG